MIGKQEKQFCILIIFNISIHFVYFVIIFLKKRFLDEKKYA